MRHMELTSAYLRAWEATCLFSLLCIVPSEIIVPLRGA